MLKADLLEALLASDLIDGIELNVAFVSHALLDRFLVPLLGDALAGDGVLMPDFIRVILGLLLESLFAQGTNNHVDAIVVTREGATVIICTGMVRAEDKFAAVTLKGQEVLLLALLEGTVLTNVTEFHVKIYLIII